MNTFHRSSKSTPASTSRPRSGTAAQQEEAKPARQRQSAQRDERRPKHSSPRHEQQPAHAPSPQPTAPSSVRLNKALADAGICSRRKADELIAQGRVVVNNKTADMGTRVQPEKDSIVVDGKALRTDTERCYLLMHKPVQVMCTVSDPEKRPTVIDILPPEWQGLRLYPVGRLDYFSEGLIILTNDGDLTQKLAHPSHHQPKVYRVRVREAVSPEMIATMQAGMTLAEGERLAPIEVTLVPYKGTGTVLELVLHQGINRQIRRICRDFGLTVLKLARIAQGSLRLGDLPVGAVRPLSEQELAALRAAAE